MKKTKLFKCMPAIILSVALMGNVMCVQAVELPETVDEAEDAFTEEFVIGEMPAITLWYCMIRN